MSSNQFPRKLDGTYEDIDCFIDCQYGNKVFSYGHGILQAYIPSLQRGHNIIKYINENFGQGIIFDIEEILNSGVEANELEELSRDIQEFNYYNNTNK